MFCLLVALFCAMYLQNRYFNNTVHTLKFNKSMMAKDYLKDENNTTQVKILVPTIVRQKLKPDSLVVLCGMIHKRIDFNKSSVELQFRVDSFLEEIKEKAINEDDLKRISLIQKKNAIGYKPIKSILKNILMRNERPRICILYARGTITDQDFDRAVKSAASQIDFTVNKNVVFANTPSLIQTIKFLDNQGYDAIALVRGGGEGMEELDDIRLFECLLNTKTPIIGGVSHVGEGFNIFSMVDDNAGTPSLLGQYFNDLVQETANEREGTINNLRQKIEAGYKPHMDRLALLEKESKSDKEQIKTLLTERTKDAKTLMDATNNYTKLSNEFNSKIQNVKDEMQIHINRWKFISFIISLICLLLILFCLYR